MTPERFERIKTVLEEALRRSSGERDAYLADACGDDVGLRSEVEKLLAARPSPITGKAQAAATSPAGPPVTVLHSGSSLGRYRVVSLLGSGGMGEVYVADDPVHARRVALKVLRPELGGSIGAQRFLREIATVAGLRHPHILPLYDSGHAEGLLYFVMPLIEGESLRDRLDRERQLPLDDALRITRDVADALDYSHDRGVVHRDIKPENILLERGRAIVADFGIATAVSAANGERLTGTGLSLGSPSYMSPEQASGERELDGRSDLYALGCVLYEMLAGEPPFTGPTPQAVIAKRFAGPAPDVGVLREGTPAHVRSALARVLARSPADRFAAATDFAQALEPRATGTGVSGVTDGADVRTARWSRARKTALAAGLISIVLAASVFLGRYVHQVDVQRVPSHPARTTAAPIRLAVLPFENLGEPGNDYFSDGMTDEVRGKLAALPGLQVIARASSNEYRRSTKRPAQIARELDVDFLLTATVRWDHAAGAPRGAGSAARTSDRVRVTPELVSVEAGGAPVTKWQQAFDAQMSDVFGVQAQVATRVAEALDVTLAVGARARLTERPTSSLAAYDAYLQGEEAADQLMVGDQLALQRARRFYRRAVMADSSYVQAWARLSMVESLLLEGGEGDALEKDVTPQSARRAAERAIALAPSRPEGRLALGQYYRSVERDASRAAEQVELGLERAPNDPDLLTASGVLHSERGRWEDALALLHRSTSLDPRSLFANWWLGRTLLWLRRYPEARETLDRTHALAPTNLGVLHLRVMVEIASGDLDSARAILRGVPAGTDPVAVASYSVSAEDLSWILDDEGQRLVAALRPEAFEGDRITWALTLARVHALRGDARSATIFADSARVAAAAQLRAAGSDAPIHASHGVALAYLGLSEQAVREGQRALELTSAQGSATQRAFVQHQLVRIYLAVGERERALDLIGSLLKVPDYLSPGWLRVDPHFAPLEGNPRFERMASAR